MYKVASNDIGSIYQITSTDSPFMEWSLERPERVIKYKANNKILQSAHAKLK